MPPTNDELVEAARRVARMEIAPDFVPGIRWADGAEITRAEEGQLMRLALYELRLLRAARPKAQRRAMRLLRSLLSPEQCRQLRQGQGIRVQGNRGGVYRLHPSCGSVWAIEKHGKHWFAVRSFCLHEREEKGVPAADRTIAHLLLLSADEAEFLSLANPTERPLDCWNGPYLIRMRQARLERGRRETCGT